VQRVTVGRRFSASHVTGIEVSTFLGLVGAETGCNVDRRVLTARRGGLFHARTLLVVAHSSTQPRDIRGAITGATGPAVAPGNVSPVVGPSGSLPTWRM
jgi:hypothetical protein